MILGRRDPLGFLKRLRGWLWPRAGWRRAGHYLVTRVKRMPGTPHSIAAGVATGVAVSLTPFVGCSTVTRSLTSWKASRSEVATSTGPRARRAAAARKSSAS